MTGAQAQPGIVDVTDAAPEYGFFACLVAAEAARREREREDITGGELAEVEKIYFGPEVGHVRRAINAITMRHMRTGGRLLDYGCGGAWWKADYWPMYQHVTACEVDRSALAEIAAAFPGARLWWTRNGVIGADDAFDVVLSSSVLGYILPEQAVRHVATAHRLLKDGGQLVLTRVLAFDLAAFLRSRRLIALPGGSFAYHYTRRELVGLLRAQGFRDIRYVNLGARLPGLSWRLNQALYKYLPWLMTGVLPVLCPFLKVQHMLVATK